jgi:hypothetical protein
VAQMEVEEGSSLELVIKLPLPMPLKPPEVEVRRVHLTSPGGGGTSAQHAQHAVPPAGASSA